MYDSSINKNEGFLKLEISFTADNTSVKLTDMRNIEPLSAVNLWIYSTDDETVVVMPRVLLVADKRNGIPMTSPGDKSYRTVEYSPDFYKLGSTLPVVNFGFVSAFL